VLEDVAPDEPAYPTIASRPIAMVADVRRVRERRFVSDLLSV
jgi:hypothetical protein